MPGMHSPGTHNGWKGLKVISLDPGGTTGWVSHTVTSKDALRHNSDLAFTGGQIGPEEHHKDLWQLLTQHDPDVVLCESFEYRIVKNQGVDMPGVNLISREYIGVAKLYATSANKLYHQQKPADVKPLWTDEKLKGLGVYNSGAPHRNDATRHMLHFVVHNLKRRDYLMALRPGSE